MAETTRSAFNFTYPTFAVLRALAHGHAYGFDVVDATGLPTGTVYPVLRRLERRGLVKSSWENEKTARREQRPTRRYYELTAAGARALEANAERFETMRRFLRRNAPLPRPS